MARTLVTGASGHLGSYLVPLLLAGGHQVSVLVRTTSDLWRIADALPQLALCYGDLEHIDAAAAQIEAFEPEVVFHLAWDGVGQKHHNESAQIDVNLNGSLRLLRTAIQAHCRCWVGLGSQAEYGPVNGILRVNTPTNPVTAYGTTKLCCGLLEKQICQAEGIRFLWLRLLATYGPKDLPDHLIPMVISTLLQGKKPSLTAGEQRWDYLYVEDAADALYQAAFASEAAGIFNLGSGTSVPVREIAGLIRETIDPKLPLGLGDLPYGEHQIMHLEADIGPLTRATGWSPQTDLSTGIARTVSWYRENNAQVER